MSRSYHFGRWTLPADLARSVSTSLPGYTEACCPERLLLGTGYCYQHRRACAPVSDDALGAELRRRGWPPRRVRSFLVMNHGGWAHKDDADDRRRYQRAYRSRTRQVLRGADGEVELEPWRATAGWLSW